MSLDVYLEIGPCEHCGREAEAVWDYNITHNLNKMADEAGIYFALWRPEEIGITKAKQLIEPLGDGLKKLLENPTKYKEHNPSNGWGDYDGLVRFVTEYIKACGQYPDANVRAS